MATKQKDHESRESPQSGAPPESLEALASKDPAQALFEGQVQGLIAMIIPDEKPPQGLAGLLDWRFQGAISRGLERGFLTGRSGECAYLPLTRAGRTYHVLLVGAAERGPIPESSLKALKKNLASLKLDRLGISRADCGASSGDSLAKHLKGSEVCLLR